MMAFSFLLASCINMNLPIPSSVAIICYVVSYSIGLGPVSFIFKVVPLMMARLTYSSTRRVKGLVGRHQRRRTTRSRVRCWIRRGRHQLVEQLLHGKHE